MPYGFTDAQWAAMPAPEKEMYVAAEAKKKKTGTTSTAGTASVTGASNTTVTPIKTATITPGVTTPKTPVVTTPTTTDPDRKLASDYASGKISKAELDVGMQKLRSTSTAPATQTGTAAQTTTDPVIQQYKDAYNTAYAAGNTLGMLDAAEAADKRRIELGQAPTNAAQIQRLESQLTPEQKLQRASNSMTNKQNELANFSQNYKPQTSEQDYMNQISSYIDSLLKQQQNETEAANKKARGGILTDADISKRELDDAYAEQLAELSSQADAIRNAYSTGKRNVETQNTDTMNDLAAQAEKILAMYEQNKSELGTDKQAVLDELAESMEKIQNAYSTSKAGIESEKAETMPTYDKAMNQQDILAQRQARQTEDEFAKRGLQAGGQVVSELGQLGQENLSQIGEITGQKQAYGRDVSNKLMGLEQEKSTSLAGAEREKIQLEQDFANKMNEIESNKSLSMADMERLKAQATRDYQNSLADLEQSQTTALSDVARAGTTATKSLSSGKMAIIQKVNNALNNLSIDEQATIADFAEQRAQMLYDAKQTYGEQSAKEKDAAFNQLLAEAGVAADSVDAIRSLIDDYNNAEMAALEYKIKELEYKNMSKTQKVELERLKQDIKLGNISAAQAERRLKLQEEEFKLDKEMQLTETERAEYNNYVNMVDSSSFVSRDANNVAQVSDKTGLRNYIIGLSLDDNVTDSLLLRYGLPINE
jgi:hypothetical protein